MCPCPYPACWSGRDCTPTVPAAAAGAALLLCARRFEPELAAITAASRVVELAADPVFQERFVEDMLLSEVTE